MARSEFDLLAAWSIQIPAPKASTSRSQSVQPGRRVATQMESLKSPISSVGVQSSKSPSGPALPSNRSKSDLICVNCVNKSLIESKRERENRLKSEEKERENRELQRVAEEIKLEQAKVKQFRDSLASELRMSQSSAVKGKVRATSEVSDQFLIPNETTSREVLREQREYREALLRQITEHRRQKANFALEEKRVELEGLKLAERSYQQTLSTSASAVSAQQQELRHSLLLQMREKAANREKVEAQKLQERQHIEKDSERYKEILHQHFQARKQQIADLAASLRSQFRHAHPEPDASGTSLSFLQRRNSLYPCSSCNRMLSRSYLTQKRWI